MRTFPPLYKKTSAGKVQEWTVAVQKNRDGSGTIIIEQGQLGGKKQRYEDHITEGKNLGKKNATTAFQQAVNEAQSRWEKQRDRRHYGEDVEANESAEKRAAAPMLAQKYPDHFKKVDWNTAMAQPKLDGNRCLARMDDARNVTLWTRKGVEILTLDHLHRELRGLMQPGETLDGEVYVHGLHVTNLRSLLTRKQEDCEKVSFRVYDLLSPAPFVERISDLNERLGDRVAEPKNGIALVETIRVMTEKELMKFQRECIEQGFEGAMLRWGQFGYEAGKRSQGLLKVKTFEDAEFKILDVVPSEGKFNLTLPDGTVKHVHVGVFCCQTAKGYPFTVTAPGTIEEKRHALKHADEYIGRKVEVKHAGWTKTEQPVPFQPVAKAIRED